MPFDENPCLRFYHGCLIYCFQDWVWNLPTHINLGCGCTVFKRFFLQDPPGTFVYFRDWRMIFAHFSHFSFAKKTHFGKATAKKFPHIFPKGRENVGLSLKRYGGIALSTRMPLEKNGRRLWKDRLVSQKNWLFSLLCFLFFPTIKMLKKLWPERVKKSTRFLYLSFRRENNGPLYY